jgi:hypothetical protein
LLGRSPKQHCAADWPSGIESENNNDARGPRPIIKKGRTRDENWDVEMQIRNDKTMRGISQTKESGTIEFKDGKWNGTSSWATGPVSGLYRNVTSDSFELTMTPFGWITLRRVPPLQDTP